METNLPKTCNLQAESNLMVDPAAIVRVTASGTAIFVVFVKLPDHVVLLTIVLLSFGLMPMIIW